MNGASIARAEGKGRKGRRLACRLGLHKWRDVRRHVPAGFTVYYLGYRCVSYWEHKGEQCACCGLFARNRTPWWVWLARIVLFGVLPAGGVVACVMSGVWFVPVIGIGIAVVLACALAVAFA